jgi:hypothetical protein
MQRSPSTTNGQKGAGGVQSSITGRFDPPSPPAELPSAAQLSLLATAIAVGTFLWGLLRHRLLLYGDATAHMMIARRIVDSLTPGLSQWGGVWLPLPHLLAAPLTLIPGFWRTGAAGSIVSICAYVLAVWFLYRIVRRDATPLAATWAALAFLLNPNLVYMAAIPMTESVYIAAMLGVMDQIGRYRALIHSGNDRCNSGQVFLHAWLAGVWALAGTMTRYDGWFMLPFYAFAFIAIAPAASVAAESRRGRAAKLMTRFAAAWPGLWRFTAAAAIGPIFWFFYNSYYFKDWLSFLRGPYSAREIYLNALRRGGQPYPGDHQLLTALHYFMANARLNTGWPLLVLAAIGLPVIRRAARAFTGSNSPLYKIGSHGGPILSWLLWLPLPWYIWAMWSGNVPIFVPQLWPHGYYNARYGLQILPAVCAFSGAAAWWIVCNAPGVLRRVAIRLSAAGGNGYGRRQRLADIAGGLAPASIRRGVAIGLLLLVAISYGRMFSGFGPITYAEAVVNSPDRLAMERQLAAALRPWHPGERVLMFLGTYPGALADDGIPLHDVIQESNFQNWDIALLQPEKRVQWIVIESGTITAAMVNRFALRRCFREVARFTAPHQNVVSVYRLSSACAQTNVR